MEYSIIWEHGDLRQGVVADRNVSIWKNQFINQIAEIGLQ